ncbi:MAG: hypothetical protein K2X86_08085 [Cytophagaceae bacterium]|nr:hypothetical protein [Cytophagaceae bacterium]
MKNTLLSILIVILIASCTEESKEGTDKNSEKELISNSFVDTSPYEFQITESSNDTFKLASDNDYFYYCFGRFSNPSELLANYNDKFEIKREKTFVYNDTANVDTLYRITVNQGFLKYLFNDEEKKMHLVLL